MKNTYFMWGWKSYNMIPDTSMTRSRMANLMRSWRNSATQGRKNFVFRLVKHTNGFREYTITTCGYINEDHAHFSVSTI